VADVRRRSIEQPDPARISDRHDFAQELTRARENVGLTIREIATVLGLPASTLGGYFGGAHLPRLGSPGVLDSILRICEITDIDEIDRWRQALRQARRASTRRPAAGAAPPMAGTASEGANATYRRPCHTVAATVPPAGAVSTRPPVHRLAGEAQVRGRGELLRLLANGLTTDVVDTAVTADIADALDPGDAVTAGRVHVLHGVGGCGKSTVALALARHTMAIGIRTWWISSTDPGQADAGMRAVAVELGARPRRLRLGSAPDQLWRRLERLREPWLLVIDDADDPLRTLALPGHRIIDATGWLRPVPGRYGTVVVTSRDGSAATWGTQRSRWLQLHPVRTLNSRDGALVLRELAGPVAGTPESARRLSDRLGGLPLALRAAGRSLGETGRIPAGITDAAEPRTFDSYGRALDQGRHRELFGHDRAATREMVGATWELSLELLDGFGIAAARPMLRLLSCLGPGPIPYALLLRAPILAGSPLFPGLTGRRMWTVLLALASVGLIDLDPDGGPETGVPDEVTAPAHTLVLPRLVRETSRGHGDVARDVHRYLAAVTGLLAAAVRDLEPDEPACWPRWRALAEHCASPLDLIREHHLRPADIPSDVLGPAADAARYLRAAGLLSRAASQYPTLIAVARQSLGTDHPYVVGLRHDLSRVWHDAGQYNRAKRGLHEVLAARRKLLGADHPDTLTTAHCLARALRGHGQLDQAYKRFTDVLDRRRRVLGDDHPDTLLTASQVADLLREQGHRDEAGQLFQHVYAARRARLGADHPATLICRLHLARLASDHGERVRAETELRELYEGLRSRIGTDHPWTLRAQQALADACHALGRLDEAERVAQEVLHARHRVLGYNHPATLASRHRLGAILHDRGDVDGAEKELQAVLEARGQALAPGHPDTARTAHRLAELRKLRNNLTDNR
jgi:tetratricopeptide (TPR) repeat protein